MCQVRALRLFHALPPKYSPRLNWRTRRRVVITSPCACMHACAKAQYGAVFTHSMAEIYKLRQRGAVSTCNCSHATFSFVTPKWDPIFQRFIFLAVYPTIEMLWLDFPQCKHSAGLCVARVLICQKLLRYYMHAIRHVSYCPSEISETFYQSYRVTCWNMSMVLNLPKIYPKGMRYFLSGTEKELLTLTIVLSNENCY